MKKKNKKTNKAAITIIKEAGRVIIGIEADPEIEQYIKEYIGATNTTTSEQWHMCSDAGGDPVKAQYYTLAGGYSLLELLPAAERPHYFDDYGSGIMRGDSVVNVAVLRTAGISRRGGVRLVIRAPDFLSCNVRLVLDRYVHFLRVLIQNGLSRVVQKTIIYY